MKKLLALIMAMAMVLSLAACGSSGSKTEDASADTTAAAEDSGSEASGDDVYTVTIQYTFPEESADGAKKVMDEIEEESGGRIKFEVYYSYSFVDTGDVVDALQTNQLDIAGFMPTDFSIFALNGRLISQPLMNYPDWEAACKIYLAELYNTPEMMSEFTDNGLVFWSGYMCPGYQYFTTDEEVSLDPTVFNGKTVMCDNSTMSTFISSNKGGAITVFPTDYLSNLQNGVAESLVQHLNCAYVFGCFDYVKNAIFFGDGGFYNLPLTYAFSQDFWDSLPSDLQEIFANHAADMAQSSYESDLALYENVAMPALEEAATITVLDDSQIAEWQDAISDTVEAAIDDIAKDAPTAHDVYADLQDKIANYDADSFDMGTTNFGTDANWS